MKHPIVIVAALTISVSVQAQSLEQGVKMYNYERYQSAKKELAPLAASNAMANYYLGLSELGMGNTDAAAAAFAKYPDDNANKSGAVRVAFARGKVAEGNQMAKELAKSAKRKEWEPIKYAADALTYSEKGDKQQAIDWYKEVMEKNEDAKILVSMGDAYLEMQGGGGQAMTSFEKAVEKDPNNSLAYSRIGKLWYDAKKYDDALANYEKAKTADPTNPLPYKYLADAYFWVNNLEKSRTNLESYLKYSDKTDDDMVRYASTLYLTKDYPKASEMAMDLLNKGVKKPSLYGIMAFSKLEMGDSAAALQYARMYEAMQETNKIGWLDNITLGKIRMMNSMSDSAEYYFNKGITANTSTDKSDVYKEIAEAYLKLKTEEGYNKASGWYGKVVSGKAEPSALDYFYWGLYAYYGHEYGIADTAYSIMEQKFPDQPSATYWRGRVAAAQDPEAKTGNATPHYERWLNTKVEGYQAKSADLMYAYQYLALYYYNTDDTGKTVAYLEKIEAIDANNSFAKQVRDALKAKKS